MKPILTSRLRWPYKEQDLEEKEQNNDQTHKTMIDRLGRSLNDYAHLLMLFLIWVGILWSAFAELGPIVSAGAPTLKDILLFFIYLEMLAMVAIYFQTKRLPVRFLIYIAITALTRVLVVDVKTMDTWTLLAFTGAILLLALAVLIIKYGSKRFPSSV